MCMLCVALSFGLVGQASAAGGVGSVTSQSIKNKENQMKLYLPSLSINESVARSAVAVFVSQLNPTIEEISDIKCAVSEAVTNAIIHGYENEIHKKYRKILKKNCFEDLSISPARMMVQDGRMPGGSVDMHIYLGRRDAFVPEHFLHQPYVSAILNQMGSKGMPECMRRDITAHPSHSCILLYDLEG